MRCCYDLLKLLCLAIVSGTIQAQPLTNMNEELRQLLSKLVKPVNPPALAQCQSNFLWDMTTEVSGDYAANIGIRDPGVSFDWYTQHFEFCNRAYIPGFLSSTRAIKTIADEAYDRERKITIGAMDLSYYEFTDDAFAKQGYYFDWNDLAIYDVPNRPAEPYRKNVAGDYNLTFFKCAPLKDRYAYRKVSYLLNPALLFVGQKYSCFWSRNCLLQVDFGNGWKTIKTDVKTDIEIIYPKKGVYTISFRILEDGKIKRTCESRIEILSDAVSPRLPDADISIQGMSIGVYNPCSSFGIQSYKPLIYVSGIDLIESKTKEELYDEFIDNGNLKDLGLQGYKIYVADWKNSRQNLLSGAGQLTALISNINDEMKKNGNPNQIVIIASSIGGVVARYTLTSMETAAGATHNCRLLVTLDSPHQGANVPLGFQHIASALTGFTGLNPAFSAITHYMDEQAHYAFLITELLDQPAVKQMLTYHIQAKTIFGAYPVMKERSDLLTALYQSNPATGGYPLQCRVVLISNGTFSGTKQGRYAGGPFQTGYAAPGDLLFGAGAAIRVTLFKKVSFKVFDWSIEARSSPDGFGSVLEMPLALHSLRMIGCLGNILRALAKPSTFMSTVSGCINTAVCAGNEYVIDMKDIDCMSGGNALYIPAALNGSYPASTGFDIGVLNAYMGIRSENRYPCFIPVRSAIDYGGPMNGRLKGPAHLNLKEQTFTDIANAIGATVICGSSGNWVHNQWGPQINDPQLVDLFIRPNEIGADNMRLDNYTLSRRAYFEARYTIEAGTQIFKSRYTYPGSPLGLNAPISKEAGFIAGPVLRDPEMPETWSYITFCAGNQVVLKAGFSAIAGTRFHACLLEQFACQEGEPASINRYASIQDTKTEPLSTGKALQVFPNPASERMIVSVPATSDICLRLMTLSGILIDLPYSFLSREENHSFFEVNLSDFTLPDGIYILLSETEGAILSQKISIVHNP